MGGSTLQTSAPLAGTERFGRLPRSLSDLRHHDADINADGTVDLGDINPFVLALTDPSAYMQMYGGALRNRDINGDGNFDFGDINPFVALLTGG